MEFDAPHIGYVAAAYGLTFGVLAGLIGWTLARSARLSRRLVRMEGAGAPRRARAADAK